MLDLSEGSMIKPTDAMNITLDGVEQPKRIWLQSYPHAGEVTWCQDQNPEGDDELETVEYVRADTRPQSPAPSPDADLVTFLRGFSETARRPNERERIVEAADRIEALTPASPDADLVEEARFLIARLLELECDLLDDDVGRQYYGHVAPSRARLQSAIEALTATAPPSDAEIMRQLRPSKETLDRIQQAEEANAAGYAVIRNMPLGSDTAPPSDSDAKGGEA